MRILFLTHAFNSLTQRLFAELERRGHELSLELDVNDAVTREAVAAFEPDVVLAPILKRAIPAEIWRQRPCLVVHPGIPGDRGPSALDWAVQEGIERWGVTVLQAEAEMDAGPVWAWEELPMRDARKSSLYRNEVTEAAVAAVLRALERLAAGDYRPLPASALPLDHQGGWRPLMRQADRRIDWSREDTRAILRRIRAADGQPGVRDELAGRPVRLFDAHPEDRLRGEPGTLLARRHGAVCRATVDGAVWIGHLRAEDEEAGPAFKRPAVEVLGEAARALPEVPVPLEKGSGRTFRDLIYRERDGVGFLDFPFYNGAMGTPECERLLAAYREALERPTRVLVLTGGPDFWSNGLDLNRIEAAPSPGEESWRNIQAMNDLVRAVLTTEDRLTVSVMRGNAGAGGVFMALAADRVFARDGVVLNPHYKNMGNLYGSEYWTYLLPRRVGQEQGRAIMQRRLPLLAAEAAEIGLIDGVLGTTPEQAGRAVEDWAVARAADPALDQELAAKRQRRAADEADKPIDEYRAEELERMRLNFFGFDPSYHVARYNFVHKVPHSRTPLYLARHRSLRYGPGAAAAEA
ncbi:hydrogenase maturation protein [Thiohalorhabdus methylotrophus]|uniref:Hydrogenase maturation protein n=1 Tax=Thiohalorhabdus methylotrophus TaxID=3242694 RepID=A0ABV4TZI8_9GAMM